MAAKFGVPVCPHAGGVGLCELVQHLSIFDYVAVSGTLEDRVTEYVDHLHEHFTDPCLVENGNYLLPSRPGYSAEMYTASIEEFAYPDGSYWANAAR
jgi:L-fuconate dehydratase